MSGLTVTVVGCSGSVPGPTTACSCYLLTAGHEGREWQVVMDLGNGALGALQRYVDPLALDAVVLSHLHADHCIDLACLVVWRRHHPVHGRAEGRLPVYGPSGAPDRLARAYGVPRAEEVTDVYDFRSLVHEETFRIGPFTLTSYRVAHPVEAYGFRVECDGAVLAYTGDTDTCPELLPLMKGADLVLADTAFVDGRDVDEGIHLSGSRAAQAAVDAGGVGRLVLTHVPPWNDPEVCRAQAAAVWPGVVEMAAPGAVYRVGA